MQATRRRALRHRAVTLCIAACACGRDDAPPRTDVDSQEWVLAGPMAEVGVAEGEPEDELHDVADAMRLEDGRVLLLDAGSAQLRVFDGEGVFLAAGGGRGEGPGEFRRPARIYMTHPDSLLVDDPVLRRTSRFDTAARFVWSDPWPASTDPFPRDAWLYGRHLVDGPRRTDLRGPVRRALDALPQPAAGGYRFVVVDDDWRLWIRAEPYATDAPQLWTVWDLEADRLAHVRLPAALRPVQFGTDFVVGVATDSLGVERVRVFALEGAPERASSVTRADPVDDPGDEEPIEPISEEATRRMTDALRAIQAAQEVHYARNGSGFGYAASLSALELEEAVLDDVEAHIVEGGARGYTALIFSLSEPGACGLTVGLGGPLGWSPGTVLCR